MQTFVQAGRFAVSGKHQDEGFGSEHVVGSVAKGCAAHSFGLKMVGFLDDQSARAHGGQGGTAADQEQMPRRGQLFRGEMDVSFPIGQVVRHGGRRCLQFLLRAQREFSAEHVSHHVQHEQAREIRLARDGKLDARAREQDHVTALGERAVCRIGDPDYWRPAGGSP